ncbi:cobalamin-binding protein [Nocardioides flavus (ex Wang et al. 2016)]|uniref:Cobalamin-binding protein n=1 Tax=Nocardioides flavus (ex Wang et al. 2016) TaxID=2058780 RepID=A0ABQ3HM97_9ACTN|nr:cobalamin-binding protein [Nocardioides flavus (ex Wang et al. 2016)]GHE17799.1 cobalamin-binding protein [Nocardioides flavus (ex Wang et al. 2016)]
MRIVSLIPSATEILFAVGAGDDVVGVTFECDHPAEARERRVVSTSAMPEGLTPREIDDFVAAAMAAGEDLYRLDAGALTDLDADLVVTQDLCAVCAIDVGTVDDALRHLGCRAEVATVDPHTLDDVLASVTDIGRLTGRAEQAAALVASLEERLATVAELVAGRARPRVLVLEWTDPPFAPGHWIPEMVTRAGGEPTLGTAGAKSVRVTWEDAVGSAPDVVVCAPCGFDLEGAAALAQDVRHRFPGVPVWAVDADGHFARPGPRLVDGVEVLAGILHPDAVEASPHCRRV